MGRNALRRQCYRQQKQARQEGRLALPEAHILNKRDDRLSKFVPQWAEAGKKFAAAGSTPEKFLAWLVYQWNSCTYLKKPITFSGSSFRVWVGHLRHPYGAGDLMHLYKKRTCVLLRSEAEYQDWQGRPWWRWGQVVLHPVYEAMNLPGPGTFNTFPERFQRGVRLLLSGFGMLEVYTDLYWDNYETRANVNKMLKRVGPEYMSMLTACFNGLKAAACPAEIPE